MIIYAPILDPQIPAFKLVQVDTATYPLAIKLNFTHNLAVAYNDVTGIILRIKPMLSNTHALKNLIMYEAKKQVTIEDLKAGNLTFTQENFNALTANEYLVAGNYYKIQIAYYHEEDANIEIGPYSSIGIVRCIASDTSFTINGLREKDDQGNQYINPDIQTYIGSYSSDTKTEIVYRYKFDLTTMDDAILESSGWQFPAGEEIKFLHHQWLEAETPYKLKAIITTVNGYEHAVEYIIVRIGAYPIPTTNLILVAHQNTVKSRENGYVEVQLLPAIDNDGLVTTGLVEANGVLLRQKQGDPITAWDKLTEFSLKSYSALENFRWRDFSVEHGETYIYAIRFFATNPNGITVWSDMLQTTDPLPQTPGVNRAALTVDFENMYLGDGDKQLCIRFNPKVSSFKTTILESKQDTIGNQYPFFFRNGQVGYKEIPIAGLISYQMDQYGEFLDTSIYQNTLNLTNQNFANERKFKIRVMEWLNNGKPKLFRSASEGNYVVRLMNVNLSPEDQLGRMLHNFSATGYEVMNTDIATMAKNESHVVSFPQHITTSDTSHSYVWKQNISAQSVTIPHNENYALVEKQFTTTHYGFTLAPGVVDIQILIPNSDSQFDQSNYITFSSLPVSENGTIKASELPTLFAVPIGQCDEIIQYHTVTRNFAEPSFGSTISQAKRYAFTIGPETTCSTNPKDLLYQQKIKRLYALNIIPNNEGGWVDIEFEDMTKQRIDLSDGLSRTYHNIDNIRKIEKSMGIQLEIYALIQSASSSALDAFVLDLSVLGG